MSLYKDLINEYQLDIDAFPDAIQNAINQFKGLVIEVGDFVQDNIKNGRTMSNEESKYLSLLEKADFNIARLMIQDMRKNKDNLDRYINENNVHEYKEFYTELMRLMPELKDQSISKHEFTMRMELFNTEAFVSITHTNNGNPALPIIGIKYEDSIAAISMSVDHKNEYLIPIHIKGENGNEEIDIKRFQDYSTIEKVSNETTQKVNSEFKRFLGKNKWKREGLKKTIPQGASSPCDTYKEFFKKTLKLIPNLKKEKTDLNGYNIMLIDSDDKSAVMQFFSSYDKHNVYELIITITIQPSNTLVSFNAKVDYNQEIIIPFVRTRNVTEHLSRSQNRYFCEDKTDNISAKINSEYHFTLLDRWTNKSNGANKSNCDKYKEFYQKAKALLTGINIKGYRQLGIRLKRENASSSHLLINFFNTNTENFESHIVLKYDNGNEVHFHCYINKEEETLIPFRVLYQGAMTPDFWVREQSFKSCEEVSDELTNKINNKFDSRLFGRKLSIDSINSDPTSDPDPIIEKVGDGYTLNYDLLSPAKKKSIEKYYKSYWNIGFKRVSAREVLHNGNIIKKEKYQKRGKNKHRIIYSYGGRTFNLLTAKYVYDALVKS